MKNNCTLLRIIFFLLIVQAGFCQTFINGDFEINKLTACSYNLSDTLFNKKISNVHAFGKKIVFGKQVGEIDFQTTGCYVTPQNGKWCIGIGADSSTDAIAIELSTNLNMGQMYQLSYYVFGNTSFDSTLANVIVGESLVDSTFGNFIDSITPIAMKWKQASLNFKATQASKYITVKNATGMKVKGWNQIDNFTLSKITSTNEIIVRQPILFPNPTSDLCSIQIDEDSRLFSSAIRNALGEIMFHSNQTILDFSNLIPGLYFVETTTDKGKFMSRVIRK